MQNQSRTQAFFMHSTNVVCGARNVFHNLNFRTTPRGTAPRFRGIRVTAVPSPVTISLAGTPNTSDLHSFAQCDSEARDVCKGVASLPST
jgi:hypothetical protein